MNPKPAEASSLFTAWRDPQTAVISFVLSQRVAPVQSGFYFTNPSLTNDGRYLWFYCLYPPAQGNACQTLGVVDFVDDTIRHYPETMFMDASPFVDKETGEIYWTIGLEIWKRGPRPADLPLLVNRFPSELANHRRPRRIATHLTRSADGKFLNIDAEFSPDWFVGDIPIDGSSPARIWQKFDRCHNHVQFSPTDPDLLLLAQDGWRDAATGNYGGGEDRLWLLRRGEQARAICPDAPASSDRRGHEWWDSDGEHVWYIDYRDGTEKVNIHTGQRTNVWPHGHTHSQSDRASRYLVGDIAESSDDWSLAFYNIKTGKEIAIVTKFPVHPSVYPEKSWSLTAQTPGYNHAHYHVHPHPHFCLNDRYICYTTNVLGHIDVALTPVAQLIEKTS